VSVCDICRGVAVENRGKVQLCQECVDLLRGNHSSPPTFTGICEYCFGRSESQDIENTVTVNREEDKGKWCYSHDEEYFYGQFDTKEEAIAEGLDCNDSCQVALFKEAKLEEYLFASDILERIREHDDFAHDAYDDMLNCTKDQHEELEKSLRNVFRVWFQKNLRTVRIMDVDTLEEVISHEEEDEDSPTPNAAEGK